MAASDQLGSCFNNLGRKMGGGLDSDIVVEKMERLCIPHSCAFH